MPWIWVGEERLLQLENGYSLMQNGDVSMAMILKSKGLEPWMAIFVKPCEFMSKTP